ncbi:MULTISPECIES: 2-amino-4-hydroxy-6-hydroxymethyldihydropteridine diphosphokinase [Chromohalobacter]|uniref:2-amino-4-hydroxy-6-hydroxymethyldihydropteridine diphosphokinase n=1 Tax=Chromohalobacter israelensis (strain ATCC BAA-138 / DSM 3043 / CIP 106854 / NCIMB 13768 / 1H11) TaxID=290398 RepID=Q1QYY1_CHRI1|nr:MULTISPECIES: 2-amino-4-hydroxy-6-hydroxymethyldihydropteridine diphosphokinase [Chromohalobacter]ABE58327.1 2-amino-4-hydroxy-6-hydroxymethyldihydropteridine pyrophosphokinase [Chromohalobacter salexigens DSM 3043]MBZ5875609.1 2-amino-4-hydroxy-6-hydroxymethyldihydropteridine diphosphokinase [Chromohalobacter salexigens]MDO0944401.1 2-amino-4-hydroxy-6-hydroxymethyldihydropteridine diphosphokinase [Chromohalobacter salexigens]NQY45979.1 2-amino-4-hydroxy-6-hydroxymethyldihydropteridine diph
MTLVTVSIGSNIDRERHVLACLDAIAETFGEPRVSRVFESEPVGFEDGRNFYNLVAAFHATRPVGELQAWCKEIEAANGRLPGSPKFSPRTLDIDLLTVGDQCGHIDGVELPRDEILHHAFVLWPLAELLPDTPHPENGRTYAELWARFTAGDQHLWPVTFDWHGRPVSRPD